MTRRKWLLSLAALGALAFPVRAEGEETEAKEKPPEREKSPAEIVIPAAGTALKDSSVARREVTRFKKEWKAAESDEERLKAFERLAQWDHPEILKTAAKFIKDANHVIAMKAVSVCARQPSAKKRAGTLLMKQLKRERRNHVKAAIFVGLGVLEFEHRWLADEAMSYMRRDYGVMHLAATRYLGYIRHKPAFRILAENLDEPRPANPNSPTNPPASYWRERWFNWDRNKSYTRWAISRLVPGESFTILAEAKDWAEKHGKKHGIEW